MLCSMRANDLTGQKFGRWTVLSRAEDYRPPSKPKGGIPRWLCRCDCGTERVVRGQQLTDGLSQSCGCLSREIHREVCAARNKKHGHSIRGARSRTYSCWANMIDRCMSSANPAFSRYGMRGVVVCERWRAFENFLADMGECPSADHSIDRIDNNLSYSPVNCRWATREQQANNKRSNRVITWNGQTRALAQWAKHVGLNHQSLRERLDRAGWTLERALTEPPRRWPSLRK